MLIADLKTICASCDGSGFQAGFDEWGSLQANLRRSCPLCSGKGYTLTELGQDLWKLFRPLVKDLIQEELRQETNF